MLFKFSLWIHRKIARPFADWASTFGPPGAHAQRRADMILKGEWPRCSNYECGEYANIYNLFCDEHDPFLERE